MAKKAKKAKAGTKPAGKAKVKAKAKPANKPAVKAKAKAAPKAKAKAKKPAAKKAAPKQPPKAKTAPSAATGPAIGEHVGKAMIIQIVGDAEAYFFDFTKLGRARRDELIAHHLAAFDARKRAEGAEEWTSGFVPFALIGQSMPPPVREFFDLSAPHEGVLLHHPQTGAVLYAASKDDDKLAILSPDLEMLSPNESYISDVFDPDAQSYAYPVDRTESHGFTLGQIALLMQMAGAELTLV
jgi:hypothetical protein